jgi:pimeloyl-ACP methyl ester carboxylesterase
MTDTTHALVADLPVPGATLHYKVRGGGPLLLLLQGGDGDADGTDALAGHLAADYTVLSYDRRGLSRSPVSDPAAPVGMATHSEDASRLLAALTREPALVLGTSIGAVLGLDLISRHLGQVRLLVAHEPPVTGLLPEPGRGQAVRDQEEVEELYRREGTAAAMRKFVAVAGIRFDDREPDAAIPQPGPERIANLEFFLARDAPAVRRYQLNLPALHRAAARIVPAAGTSTQAFPRHCAQALASELGRPLAEFPGGHNGFMLRPRGFAARLHEILGSSPPAA